MSRDPLTNPAEGDVLEYNCGDFVETRGVVKVVDDIVFYRYFRDGFSFVKEYSMDLELWKKTHYLRNRITSK